MISRTLLPIRLLTGCALRSCALLLFTMLLLLPAGAQTQPLADRPAPVQTPAEIGAKLDGSRTDLNEIEAALQQPALADTDLQRLRARIDPMMENGRVIIDALKPRIDAARARLEQLGPKPAQPESGDIGRDRAERERALADLEDVQKRARAQLVEAEQQSTAISDRRRVFFTRSLFQRDSSLFAPDLWVATVQGLPDDLANLNRIAADWTGRVIDRVRDGRIWLLLIAAIAAALLIALKHRLQPGFASRDRDNTRPAPLQVATVAASRALLDSVPIMLACFILYSALDAIYLLPMRVGGVFQAIFFGVAFVAVARALGEAVLSPDKPQWRLAKIDDPSAHGLMRMVWTGSALIALWRVAEALVQAANGADPLNVAVRGSFTLAFALLFAGMLRGLKVKEEALEDACLGPYVPAPRSRFTAPLRIASWLACAIIIAGVILGYVTLASFLVGQLTWLAGLGAVLTLALSLTEQLLTAAVTDGTRLSMALQSSIGIRRKSLQQISVLAAGAVRVILIAMAVLLALAPWGLESSDLVGSLRGAFFGFTIGSYTVSLSAILGAAAIFTLGVVITRAVQRWLDRRLLPATDLDAGLQNSIQTIFGYLGIIVAASLAFVQLGLSFDRLTIVAGALSVGIGFGLQSIVSNFVSGLILLGERPIRVGDQIVVGADEGIVKRINVRATEIETFDKSVVIVPNSGLVTGVVRNKVRNNRMGRVLLTVGMPRVSDPEEVRRILAEVAGGHPDVLQTPGPTILFKKLDREALEFDLICFVADLSKAGLVNSDLNFEIYRRLKTVGLAGATPQPAPPPQQAPTAAAAEAEDTPARV